MEGRSRNGVWLKRVSELLNLMVDEAVVYGGMTATLVFVDYNDTLVISGSSTLFRNHEASAIPGPNRLYLSWYADFIPESADHIVLHINSNI